MVLSDIFGQPIEPSIDSMALRILEDPNQYGAYRMYGTISWGLVGGPLAGYILRSNGVESLFVVHGIVMLCTATVVCLIPHARPRPQQQTLPDSADADCGGGVAQVVGTVFQSPSIIFCFLAAVLISGAMALINSYSFLVAQDMGDTGVVIGLVPLFSALGEIPSFLLSDRILQQIVRMRPLAHPRTPSLSPCAPSLSPFAPSLPLHPCAPSLSPCAHSLSLFASSLSPCAPSLPPREPPSN
jgi:hypothetical protein